jgi:hypothetical protein
MNTSSRLLLLGCCLATATNFLRADANTSVQADSIVSGEQVILRASSSNASIDFISLFASGPNIPNSPAHLGYLFLSGNEAHGEFVWTPPATGTYEISTIAYHVEPSPAAATVVGTAQTTFDVFTGRRIIRNVTIANGVSRLFAESGEILTGESSPVANVISENGGTMIFWAGGRLVLKSGFHAKPGSFFWAAVDSDNDGYSEMEEATDTDGDGMFDAWEVEHGLNPIANDANGDLDGDGLTNLQEFQQGRNPQVKDNPSIALVIFTPSS